MRSVSSAELLPFPPPAAGGRQEMLKGTAYLSDSAGAGNYQGGENTWEGKGCTFIALLVLLLVE